MVQSVSSVSVWYLAFTDPVLGSEPCRVALLLIVICNIMQSIFLRVRTIFSKVSFFWAIITFSMLWCGFCCPLWWSNTFPSMRCALSIRCASIMVLVFSLMRHSSWYLDCLAPSPSLCYHRLHPWQLLQDFLYGNLFHILLEFYRDPVP